MQLLSTDTNFHSVPADLLVSRPVCGSSPSSGHETGHRTQGLHYQQGTETVRQSLTV